MIAPALKTPKREKPPAAEIRDKPLFSMKDLSPIRTVLERAYLDYHSSIERTRDPVNFPHRYEDPADQEIVAFFSALLAYGNVRSILSSVEKVLRPLGTSPRKTLLELEDSNLWEGFKHRFTTEDDVRIVAAWLQKALQSHGSLEEFFVDTPTFKSGTMKEVLSDFIVRFTNQPLPEPLEKAKTKRQRNLKYLLSDPERGSACKRLNLFLRWVVRPKDGIDLGVWKKVETHRLMLPIDTHLLQTLKKLRWTRSKTANWKVVEASTEKLRALCPEDPIKYDFSLCHLSMRGGSITQYRNKQK